MTLIPLKPKADVLMRDSWWDAFGAPDGAGGVKRKSFDEYYDTIARVELNSRVPESVAQSFENARNTYLYAFFAHRLLMVAELQVRVSVEFALRERARIAGVRVRRNGVKDLLRAAIKHHWIFDIGFERFRRNETEREREVEMWTQIDPKYSYEPPTDTQKHCRVLAEVFPKLRNELAHGSDMLHTGVFGTFEISADIINQLFPAQVPR